MTDRKSSISTTRLKNAPIKWDSRDKPRSLDFDDIYFSSDDPIAESTHVFIRGTDLPESMAEISDHPLVIGECGFGFGLNFLNTCEHFCRLAVNIKTLHFISCELHPVLKSDLQRFYRQLPAVLEPYCAMLLESYPEQGEGLHRLAFQMNNKHIILDLIYREASAAFAGLSTPGPVIDAWFLDGFSPGKNPAIWTLQLCNELARLGKPGARLASYSVAGFVRKHLESAGFSTAKITGYGRKRQMLSASLEKTKTVTIQHGSWQQPWCKKINNYKRIAIIGGGVAGCSTAHALALRGFKIILFEKNPKLASAASGNARGAIHLNPARRLTSATRFRLNAYTFAVRHYSTLANFPEVDWQSCGQLQLATDQKTLDFFNDLMALDLYDPALIRTVNKDAASQLANIALDCGGLYFPDAGSLDPVGLCLTWTDNKNIELRTGHELTDFIHQDDHWHLTFNTGEDSATEKVDAVILCNAIGAGAFPELPDYPLISNHGQTDTFITQNETDNSADLATILGYQGYAMPWHVNGKNRITLGGSFAQGEHDSDYNEAMLAKNLGLLEKISPHLKSFLEHNQTEVVSRIGTRCTTPDYMPLVGPVEDTEACNEIFAGYKRNARKHISAGPAYMPGLFINIGHGSSGLTWTPLVAEYLAALICEESLPVSAEEVSAIHPLRFLIRNLKKQQN